MAAANSPQMDDADLREILQPIFTQFDADKSGFISTVELSAAVKALGVEMTKDQVWEMIEEADPNGTGDIDFDEFCAAIRTQMEQNGTELPNRGLSAVVNRAGGRAGLVIEEEEKKFASYGEDGLPRFVGELPLQLLEIMKKKHARVLEIFNTFDVDGDGAIECLEFVRVIQQLGVAQGTSEADLKRLFVAIDKNGNGSMSFAELQEACSASKQGRPVLKMTDEEREARALALSEMERAKLDALDAEAAARLAAEEEARLQRERDDLQAAKDAERRRIAERRRLLAEEEKRKAEEDAERLRKQQEALRLAALAMQEQMEANKKHRAAPQRERPAWTSFVSPRVERTKALSMFSRAEHDLRPASVSHARPGEEVLSVAVQQQWQGAIRATLRKKMAATAFAAGPFSARPSTAPAEAPTGRQSQSAREAPVAARANAVNALAGVARASSPGASSGPAPSSSAP